MGLACAGVEEDALVLYEKRTMSTAQVPRDVHVQPNNQ